MSNGRSLRFHPLAAEDLASLYGYIAEDSPLRAATYVRRLRDRCDELRTFPLRGRPRDDVAPGLRSLAFERTALILYRVEGEGVTVLRVLYRGRDLATIVPE